MRGMVQLFQRAIGDRDQRSGNTSGGLLEDAFILFHHYSPQLAWLNSDQKATAEATERPAGNAHMTWEATFLDA
jgi:hypothetical protein